MPRKKVLSLELKQHLLRDGITHLKDLGVAGLQAAGSSPILAGALLFSLITLYFSLTKGRGFIPFIPGEIPAFEPAPTIPFSEVGDIRLSPRQEGLGLVPQFQQYLLELASSPQGQQYWRYIR